MKLVVVGTQTKGKCMLTTLTSFALSYAKRVVLMTMVLLFSSKSVVEREREGERLVVCIHLEANRQRDGKWSKIDR